MKTLTDALEAGTFAPVYLLYGNEPGPVRACVAAIRKHVLEPGMEAFNHERFAGRELEGAGPVLTACTQLPVMASARLVELDDPEAVGKGKGDAAKASQDALIAYMKAPNPTTVLVLVSSGIDGRSRLVSTAKKAGFVAKFEQIKRDRDAVDFVYGAARDAGTAIDRDAAEQMVLLVGTGQSALLAALERASLHAGQGATVSLADVTAVCGHTRDAVIFELTDAVGMGNRDRALTVLARLFTESAAGEIGQANQTLAMLIRQLRLVFTAKAAGGNPARIGQVAGVPPFVAKKLAQQSRGFDEARLRRAYAGLSRLDRDLKGGSFSTVKSPYLALQRWILEVCDALPGVAPRT
ncbi:MAG: DNA polymerase III subunit delta [Myxococcota bacterium]